MWLVKSLTLVIPRVLLWATDLTLNGLQKMDFLSVLTAIFPGEPGLAGTRMSPFRILLELRMTEVVITTGTIRCAKLQSSQHHQQTNQKNLLVNSNRNRK